MAFVTLATAGPAAAVRVPHVSMHQFQAYHYADSYGQVQHYDRVGGAYKLGNWAKPGKWSNQTACWVGVSSYYYNFKS